MQKTLPLMANGKVIPDTLRQRCEVWTRVMGYYRPVSEFNPGKKGEHDERTHFVEPGLLCSARNG